MQKIPPGGGALLPYNSTAGVAVKPPASPPVLLTIAGFDPSSGAGITADLKVFAAHGFYGVACATALTVQSTKGVRRFQPVSGELIADTLACLSDDLPIGGVKIGMLGSRAAVQAVAAWLGPLRTAIPGLPVVLDPVLRSSSGAELLPPEALETLRAELLPLVTVVTPNLAEAALLANRPCRTRNDVPEAARWLATQTGAAVLVTGGHLPSTTAPEDYLLEAGAEAGTWYAGEWVRTRATHGTGCALSSALLCRLTEGCDPAQAVPAAKHYVEAAMRAAYPVGGGRGPMHHLFPCAHQLQTGETARAALSSNKPQQQWPGREA